MHQDEVAMQSAPQTRQETHIMLPWPSKARALPPTGGSKIRPFFSDYMDVSGQSVQKEDDLYAAATSAQ
jgi:hypothetical protein